MSLESKQDTIEQCTSVKQCRKKKSKPTCYHINVEKDSSQKKQAMKRYWEIPIVLNKTRFNK